jgi:hypothetical protein
MACENELRHDDEGLRNQRDAIRFRIRNRVDGGLAALVVGSGLGLDPNILPAPGGVAAGEAVLRDRIGGYAAAALS